MEKKTLLIRFRPYLFALMVLGGLLIALGYDINNADLRAVGLVVLLGGGSLAVVLNNIDETPKGFE